MTEAVTNILMNAILNPMSMGALGDVPQGQESVRAFEKIIAEINPETSLDGGMQLLNQALQQAGLGDLTLNEGVDGQFLQALQQQLSQSGEVLKNDGSPLFQTDLLDGYTAGEELPSGGNLLPLPSAIVSAISQQKALPSQPVVSIDGKVLAEKSVPVAQHAENLPSGMNVPSLPLETSARPERVLFQQLIAQGERHSNNLDVSGQIPGVLPTGDVPELNMPPLQPNGIVPVSAQAVEGLAHQPASERAATVIRLETPLGQPGWDAEVSSRVNWLVQNKISSAEIRLNPPELGPVEVRIKADGDQTSILFTAQQPATREALEQALPRLREAFEAGGLQLADAGVSEHGLREGEKSAENNVAASSRFSETEEDTANQVAAVTAGSETNMIDFYI